MTNFTNGRRKYDPNNPMAGLPKECGICDEPGRPAILNGRPVVVCEKHRRLVGAR